MDRYNILIVDDDNEIRELIEIYLKNEGYNVLTASDGNECLDIMDMTHVHLVVLDIIMPGIDGMEVCARIRRKANIPVIMLSARSQDMDKILGLGIGADDYMTKPFNPMELIARIKSQLRRYFHLNEAPTYTPGENCIKIKGLSINKYNHSVSLYGKNIGLTPTEYEILLLLAQNPGKVFSSEEIFERVWKEKYLESNNTVMVHMWRLREKIEENPKEPVLIETVWGVGYKIEK